LKTGLIKRTVKKAPEKLGALTVKGSVLGVSTLLKFGKGFSKQLIKTIIKEK